MFHHAYMILSFCTVSAVTLKSTRMLWFNSRPAPRRPFSAAEADGCNSKTLLPVDSIFFFIPFSPTFLASSTFWNTLEFDLWMVMCPSGSTPLLSRLSSPLAGFFPFTGSSFGQVDDRHPLIHAAAFSAEPVHFAQSGILP